LARARLGVYEVTAQLGVGGMGEVYRATDTKLKRQVAIKILPSSLAADPDRLARFQREAEVLASLNHPNIAAIYGLEDADGVKALVMKLVEGEDLAQRITRGAISLDEALPIARQIAEALEAAHEQGIIHRDLKPANIKVRDDGTVKVLDFGLAKAMEPTVGSLPSVSQSPTITTPAMTQAGMILGTAAYMSPEQAKGRPADRRSDIWSFGCVLYEMLSGTRAFGGEDVPETLAVILTKEPDWSALPRSVPAGTRALLQRCLTKDRRRRLDSAAIVRLDIDEALTRPATDATTVHEDRDPLPARMIASVAFLAVGALAGWFAAMWFRAAPASSPPVAQLVANVSPAEHLLGVTPDERRLPPHRPSKWAVAWAPDGSRFVFTAVRGNTQQLYMRSLDRLESEPIPGTENSDTPFFSPNGDWLGFWQGNELKKMPANGGSIVRICATPPIMGASWGSNDVVVFGSPEARGLMRVPADGSTPPRQLTTAKDSGDISHRFPHVLPGGNAVLFTAIRDERATVVVRALETGEHTPLVEGADARYVASGHIIYVADNATLMAAPFDLEQRRLTGSPVGLWTAS